MARPYFSTPIDRLEALAGDADTSLKIIKDVREELEHRSTFRAAKLRQQLDARLRDATNQSALLGTEAPPKLPSTSPSATEFPLAECNEVVCPPPALDPRLLPIAALVPSVRANGVLARLGIKTVGDLAGRTSAELLRQPNCGRTTLNELRKKLRGLGLSFHDPASLEAAKMEVELPSISPEMLNVRLLSIELSTRAKTFLQQRKIQYAGELCQLTEAEVWRSPNVGRTTVRELGRLLDTLGLRFGMRVDEWSSDTAKALPAQSLPLAFQTPEPNELEAALRVRVEMVTSSERNLRWTIEHLGWDGERGRTLEAIGTRDNVTRERVRQIAAKACQRLKERGAVPLALRHTVALVRANLPLTQTKLDALMQARGLASRPFNVLSIKAAAEVYGLRFPFVIIDRDDADPLIFPRSLAGFPSLFIRTARRAVAAFGCIVDDQLLQLAEEIAGKPVDLPLIHSILERDASFARLQTASDWWWRPDKANQGRNRLVNTVTKVLAACPSIHVRELREAVRRPHRSKQVAPPSAVLESLCASLPFCSVQNAIVTRAGSKLDWSAVLNPSEQILLQIFDRLGPVAHSYQISELGLALGMNENSLNIYKSYSPLLWRPAQGYYALIGSEFPAGLLEELQAKVPSGPRAFIESGWTADGRVFLCHQVSKGMWHSGLVSVPSSVQSLLQGTFQLSALGRQSLGQIEVREATIFSYRKLFRLFGAEEGDVLLSIFNIKAGVCEAWLGGSEMERLMREGKADDVLAGLTRTSDIGLEEEADSA